MRGLRAGIFLVLAALLMALAPAFQAAAQGKPKIEVVAQIAHPLGVRSVALSPDGTRLLSGS